MMPRGRFKPRRFRHVATVAAVAFAGPFLAGFALGIRINISPSLPIGLYWKTPDPSARLVEFCPEEPYARLALQRRYRSLGNCPDGGAPMMKPVIAGAGDIVKVSENGIAVNGSPISNTAPKQADGRGRPMYGWCPGEYLVPQGFVWVASSYNEWSFDSRYFGPTPISAIRARLKPVSVFR